MAKSVENIVSFHDVDEDPDVVNWSLDQYKNKRTGAKASLTKKINAIYNSVRNDEGRRALRLLESQLLEKLSKCRYWHQRYVDTALFSYDETQSEAAWLTEVEGQVKLVQESIASYVRTRKTSSSSASDFTASSVSSQRRKELERHQIEEEIRIESEKRRLQREKDMFEFDVGMRNAQLNDDLMVIKKRVEEARRIEIEDESIEKEINQLRFDVTAPISSCPIVSPSYSVPYSTASQPTLYTGTIPKNPSTVPYSSSIAVPSSLPVSWPVPVPVSFHTSVTVPFSSSVSPHHPPVSISALSSFPTMTPVVSSSMFFQPATSVLPPVISSVPVHSNINSLPVPSFPIQTPVLPVPSPQAPPPVTVRLPKVELATFDGNIKDWPLFFADFTSMVENMNLSNAQKMAYLRVCLSKKVKNSISQFMYDPNLYPQEMAELTRQFGHPYILALAHIKSMLDLPTVKDDGDSILDFVNELNGAVGALSNGQYSHELSSSGILAQLTSKLPLRLQQEWSTVIYSIQPRAPTISDLCAWLNYKSRSEQFQNPFAPSNSSKASTRPKDDRNLRSSKKMIKEKKGFVFSTNKPIRSKPIHPCPACKEDHFLSACNKFKAMSLTIKNEIVWENKVCLRCLKPGHGIKICRSQITCGIDGCVSKHNPQLHGAPPLLTKSENKTRTPAAAPADTPVSPSGNCGHTSFSGSVLLSVVPIRISANGRYIDTQALLDNGSQLTLIRNDIAEQLSLKDPKSFWNFPWKRSGNSNQKGKLCCVLSRQLGHLSSQRSLCHT